MKRVCKVCNTEKEFNLTNFRKGSNSQPSGRVCKLCYNESRKDYDRSRYLNKKEERRISNKAYRTKHKKRLSQQKKEYYIKNKKQIREYKRKWARKRREDPFYKINSNFSCLIYQSLKRNKKRNHWEDIVGYTLKDLIKHLESLWEPWMNWDNYGMYYIDGDKAWHIDHVIPKSWFNYTSYEDPEFKVCWALSNLQPKEAKENIIKNNNYIG